MTRKLTKEEIEKRRVTEAANNALKSLKAAKRCLDAAFALGVIDIVGGMFIISGLKLAQIEAAKRHIREAMTWLQQYRRETDNTDYVNAKYMKLGVVGSVIDFGFDGVGPDVYAQTRIAGLRSRVKEAIKRLEIIMKMSGLDKY